MVIKPKYGLRICRSPIDRLSEPLQVILVDPEGEIVPGQTNVEYQADYNGGEQTVRVTFPAALLDIDLSPPDQSESP